MVTFTKMAAAEMRGRVLNRLYKELEKDQSNSHLQRQITLLPKASISTIDAFCLDVVKNNFFEIDISPNLKIAEGTEIEILKSETIEEIFEEKYETGEKDFLALIDTYTGYRGDEALKEIVLEMYNYTQTMPFPEKWLEEKIEMFNLSETSFESTVWGNILFNKVKDELNDGILNLENELERIKYEQDVEKFILVLSEDIRKMKEVYDKQTWDKVYLGINELHLDRFPVDKRVPDEIKEDIKNIRNKIKEQIKKIGQSIMIYTSEEANENIREMYGVLKQIQTLVLEFGKAFSKEKQDRNIMDFSDIEHFALNILASKEVADRYREKYEEILIDEYQDSNLVQEYILNGISKGNNTFMVGDVKQSIYKFRGARPELFLRKYEKYKQKEEKTENEDLKIQLFKNFRSRKNVLGLTNIIFQNIMSKELGDIDYDEKEYLNLGADWLDDNCVFASLNFTSKSHNVHKYASGFPVHLPSKKHLSCPTRYVHRKKERINLKAELHIIDLKEREESIYKEDISEDEDVIVENIEDVLVEAKFVANKIKELIDSGYMVLGKDKTYRKITYKDIAVLLRSTQNLAPIYEQEISKLNLPVFCDTSVRIFRFNRNSSYVEPS